ncbi:PEP-CTERM sorting domain-containing protein [Azohydromonas caseinilytica]|uniref:PEP-CTERM sorting domain-containing protein n=1 Tax=Azohydromonas caseinilytica TaxID=2728836 RepID=A0A848F5C5_9BURK|nr:PEP-CTERM sorting domain-containing protein [Azohydromonas caseinilytica]NML13895.1 PEP-CTERM sorting domain-containing protein [Azohydromonas caseinilytica]
MSSLKAAVAALSLVASSLAGAAIIDHGTYTTDTRLRLDYLDVGLLHGTYANFSSGVVFGGRTWMLATPGQIAHTWSDATGLSLIRADILSGDNDMTRAAVATLFRLFDGVTGDVGQAGERVIGNYAVDGYYQFIRGGSLATHTVFDDSHFVTDTEGSHSAWLVSQAPAVPEPSVLVLATLGVLGVGVACRTRR